MSTRPRKKSATRATSASCRRHGIFIEIAAATSNDLIQSSARLEGWAAGESGAIAERTSSLQSIRF
jgi:hypothetical protein